jgi:hypothetical protein
VKIVKPDRAGIRLLQKGMTLVEGAETVELGHLEPGEKKEVRWRVRIESGGEQCAEISIHSTRGGVRKKTIILPD